MVPCPYYYRGLSNLGDSGGTTITQPHSTLYGTGTGAQSSDKEKSDINFLTKLQHVIARGLPQGPSQRDETYPSRGIHPTDPRPRNLPVSHSDTTTDHEKSSKDVFILGLNSMNLEKCLVCLLKTFALVMLSLIFDVKDCVGNL